MTRTSAKALLALAFFVFATVPRSALAEAEAPLKAAFIYQFTHYVEWPPSAAAASSVLSIAVLDDPELEAELSALAERKRGSGRRIEVIRSDNGG